MVRLRHFLAALWLCAAATAVFTTDTDTVPRGRAETSDVYTFFSVVSGRAATEQELGAIAIWNLSWTRAGWTTHVIGWRDAEAHPNYTAYLEAYR